MFKLEGRLGGSVIDLNTGPYYAAVISSHGYPAGNDTDPGRYTVIKNMDLGVYITYTLITNTRLHDQKVKVLDGERSQAFEALLTPFSLKHQRKSGAIRIVSEYWADSKAQPVFLLAYEGMVAKLRSC